MRDNDDFFDKNVIAIMKLIEKNNFSVEIVGGAVRDYILSLKDSKIKSNNIDFDLATNASTEEIKKIFIDHKVILDGEKFGTVKVLLDEKLYEITTYRIDGSYRDKRRPERVYFTNEIKNDLSRRDFTINAIAMKSDREVIDFFGGMDDIENKIIRCVGNPEERFEEDYLRMFRAIRFAVSLNFNIHEETSNAIKSIVNNREELFNLISNERKYKELKVILRENAIRGFQLLHEHGLAWRILPLKKQTSLKQLEDLIENLIRGFEIESDWYVKMGLIGYGMESILGRKEGKRLFTKYLIDLSFPKIEREYILNLLEYQELPPSIMIENPDEKLLLKWMRDYEKKFVYNNSHELKKNIFRNYLQFQRSINFGFKNKRKYDTENGMKSNTFEINNLSDNIENLVETYKITNNIFDGNKLNNLGLNGKIVGWVLEDLNLKNPKSDEEAYNYLKDLLYNKSLCDKKIVSKEFHLIEGDPWMNKIINRRKKIQNMVKVSHIILRDSQ